MQNYSHEFPWVHAVLTSALLMLAAAPGAAATCAPPKLVHIAVSNVTPGVDPASFNAQPRTYYRIGSDKMRVEEAVDAANGIHGLIVVAEPNIWMVNLYNNTGKHIVDPGPTFFARAPVFGTGISSKLIGLEFGCENDFIAANAPTAVRTEQIGGASFSVFRVDDGPDAVEILEKSGSTTPAFARYYHQGTLAAALRYDLYLTGLPDDPSLFVPPATVQYTNAGQ